MNKNVQFFNYINVALLVAAVTGASYCTKIHTQVEMLNVRVNSIDTKLDSLLLRPLLAEKDVCE